MIRLFCSMRGWLSPVFVCILIGRLARRTIPTMIFPITFENDKQFLFRRKLTGTVPVFARRPTHRVAVS